MRVENFSMYSGKLDKEIEREFKIYKRDELIKYIQDNNINLSEYVLEVHAPHYLKCTIEVLKTMNENDEFFFFEEDKTIYMYLE